ncbi:translation initiation factor 1 [Lacibacter cauensis]|uniref:Translation initiation factor 1 n=1 Tax=Lacibacter cauensis TaxID=510947 RepID=A0A562SQD9_9BACT|nr:translation initiation factor [Lacibacter cauensis]TWI83432.1 translation initiation factor 1 [Lacibacter cauensis]
MSKKNKPDNRGFVFSTDPDFRFEEVREEKETLPPAQQNLRVKLETKHRAGKTVTLVDGFVGTDDDAEKLGKQLKNVCGTGGSVKDGEIIVQGDHREKVLQFLLKNGYAKTKKAG